MMKLLFFMFSILSFIGCSPNQSTSPTSENANSQPAPADDGNDSAGTDNPASAPPVENQMYLFASVNKFRGDSLKTRASANSACQSEYNALANSGQTKVQSCKQHLALLAFSNEQNFLALGQNFNVPQNRKVYSLLKNNLLANDYAKLVDGSLDKFSGLIYDSNSSTLTQTFKNINPFNFGALDLGLSMSVFDFWSGIHQYITYALLPNGSPDFSKSLIVTSFGVRNCGDWGSNPSGLSGAGMGQMDRVGYSDPTYNTTYPSHWGQTMAGQCSVTRSILCTCW